MVKVGEIMQRDLVSVPYGSSIVQAAKKMRDRQVGSVFVMLDGPWWGL